MSIFLDSGMIISAMLIVIRKLTNQVSVMYLMHLILIFNLYIKIKINKQPSYRFNNNWKVFLTWRIIYLIINSNCRFIRIVQQKCITNIRKILPKLKDKQKILVRNQRKLLSNYKINVKIINRWGKEMSNCCQNQRK